MNKRHLSTALSTVIALTLAGSASASLCQLHIKSLPASVLNHQTQLSYQVSDKHSAAMAKSGNHYDRVFYLQTDLPLSNTATPIKTAGGTVSFLYPAPKNKQAYLVINIKQPGKTVAHLPLTVSLTATHCHVSAPSASQPITLITSSHSLTLPNTIQVTLNKHPKLKKALAQESLLGQGNRIDLQLTDTINPAQKNKTKPAKKSNHLTSSHPKSHMKPVAPNHRVRTTPHKKVIVS